MRLDLENIDKLIDLAIEEDIGEGDVTTNSIVPDNLVIDCTLVAREAGVVAGLPVAGHIFGRFGGRVNFVPIMDDGDNIAAGDLLARLIGDARTILAHERIALNFLQRLSGIATLTATYVQRAKNLGVDIVDTRKTTPGWRHIEKYAVRVGGGKSHRMGLFDQVLIKDNHLGILNSVRTGNGAGGGAGLTPQDRFIVDAVQSARKQVPQDMLIEIEVDQPKDVADALESGADIIMFDNMNPDQISASLQVVSDWEANTTEKRPTIEVSGGVTITDMDRIGLHGIDRIAIGAITHSAKALDIAMDVAM